jgi:hypothetical protein
MKKFIFLILIIMLISIGYSQKIIRPGEKFSSDDTTVVLTVKQFRKADSLLTYSEKIKEENNLYKKRAIVSDSLHIEDKKQLSNINTQNFLLEQKLVLKDEKDTLRLEQIRVKNDIIKDLEKDIEKNKNKNWFSNNALWFGAGSITGAIIIYLSSIILSNIDG